METNYLILSFFLIPMLGFIIGLITPRKNERLISGTAYYTLVIQLILLLPFTFYWIYNGAISFEIQELVLYHSKVNDFIFYVYFDKITATYLIVGTLITLLIVRYSSYYMHLEAGHKRFFNTVLFFYLGYNITVLSGNFETLFIGWEILGISSFLLIAFYRDRYLPVRNAVKVFSIYRIGDVAITLTMWGSHHLWHQNITFSKLNNHVLVLQQTVHHQGLIIFISVCLLVAAAAKSAQFPFTSWLPRAMEGPTPSSAIFYGSLSVHFGVFLLLRTMPFWETQIVGRILIGGIGLITAIISYYIMRVQTTIKTQIAYASLTQIGIMFIEIALGLETIVLIHFAGNAFLRTYQLLISPSIVSYKMRDQLYHYKEPVSTKTGQLKRRLEHSLYVLSLNEWGLDKLMNRIVFTPFKRIGRSLYFINNRNFWFFVGPIIGASMLLLWREHYVPDYLHNFLPEILAGIGFVMVCKSFAERFSPMLAWWLVAVNHFLVAVAITFNEQYEVMHTALYLSGVSVAAVIGYLCLRKLRKLERSYFDLNQYFGHIYEHPILASTFFICCLGLMGFPITTSFIGEDLIISHIQFDQFTLAFFYSVSYVLGGISLIRIYARLFLGTHIKNYHETSLKSA